MHRDRPKKPARASGSSGGIRKRTDGSPRLIAPGAIGNPYRKHYAIAWTERAQGERPRSRVITTRETEEARARDALIVFKTEMARPPREKEITVAKICNAFIEARRPEVKSLRSLQSALQPIMAAFGPLSSADVQATNISAYIVDRLKTKRRRGARGGKTIEIDGTVSRKTIKNELIMFKAACNWAKDEGWDVTIPPIKKQKRATTRRKRTLSRAEAGRLFRALDAPETPKHLRTFVLIAILTGQRSSAIRDLKWEHVDFDEGMLWFTRSRPDAPDNKRVQDHPMTDTLERVLREAKQGAFEDRFKRRTRGREPAPMLHVIEHKQRAVGSLKTAWHALLVRAKVEGVWMHDLRRTAATLARNSGRSNQEVALYLNDSEEVTKRTYAHASPALLLPMQETIATIMEETRSAVTDE